MSKAPRAQIRPRPGGCVPAQRGCVEGGIQSLDSRRRMRVFLAILISQAERAGREVIAVDPRNTSRSCPRCGHVAKEDRPTQEKSHCHSYDHTKHADTVGALNVLRARRARGDANPA